MSAERNGNGVLIDSSVWIAYAFDRARNFIEHVAAELGLLTDEQVDAEPEQRVLRDRAELLELALADSWTGRALRPADITRIDEIARFGFVPQRVIGGVFEVRLLSPGIASNLEHRVANEGKWPSVAHMLEIADEGLRDYWFRGVDANTELRVCALCDGTFIPDRPGRARYCSTRCRMSSHRLRSQLVHGDSPRRHEHLCRSCGAGLTPDNYSGLGANVYSELDTVPRGLLRAQDGWCLACALEQIPRWKRYLAPFETPDDVGVARRLDASR